MKKIIIFGGGGQLGQDLNRVLESKYKVSAFDRSQADITDRDSVLEIIREHRPDYIINAAAYNKVELAESEAEIAYKVNAPGPYYLACGARENNAILIHFSTDYVFDGIKKGFDELDIPHPLNVYGASKFAGEQLIEIAGSRHYIIRTSALFGAGQSGQKINFVDRVISLARLGQPIKMVDDQYTIPTYSLDLAEKVGEFIANNYPLGVYHITSRGFCSWYEFALKTLELADLKAEITPVKTDLSATKIIRPKFSVLLNTSFAKLNIAPLPFWPDAVKRYIQESKMQNLT